MGSIDPVIPERIILFDGVCNLCNSSVQFVINRDPKGKFHFAALQSPFAQELLRNHGMLGQELYSIIFIKNGKVYERSRAALEVARNLTGLWPLLYLFVVVPPFIRNAVYDWVAGNRYKWFGERNECMIPTPELKSRFLG